MNHLIERNEDALSLLLSEKSFDDLTHAERMEVLEIVNEEEYRLLRETAMLSRISLQDTNGLTPRASTRSVIKNRMKKRQSLKRNRLRWNSFRNPAYQVAAAIAILALFIHVGNRPSQSILPVGKDPQIFSDSTTRDSSIRQNVDSSEDTVFSELFRTPQQPTRVLLLHAP